MHTNDVMNMSRNLSQYSGSLKVELALRLVCAAEIKRSTGESPWHADGLLFALRCVHHTFCLLNRLGSVHALIEPPDLLRTL